MKELEHFNGAIITDAILYIYTPMCGTCKLAEQMMALCEMSKPFEWYYKLNINKQIDLANTYKIESVPCLLLIKNGILEEKIYAFESVTNIFNKISVHFE